MILYGKTDSELEEEMKQKGICDEDIKLAISTINKYRKPTDTSENVEEGLL